MYAKSIRRSVKHEIQTDQSATIELRAPDALKLASEVRDGNHRPTEKKNWNDDYTYPKDFDALNPNLASELSYHPRFPRYPNLKVRKTRFFALFENFSPCKSFFFLKTDDNIWNTCFCPSKPHCYFLWYLYFWQRYRSMKFTTLWSSDLKY